MALPKFKVGDICHIKKYSDLLFVCDHEDEDCDLVFKPYDDLLSWYYYNDDMELCGQQFTITDVREEFEDVFEYLSEEFPSDRFEGGWLLEDALELGVPEGPSVDSANLVQNLCDLFEGVA